ncbi:MAG: LURP-one-related family protein [Eubacteriaceae bacterium]|nr:LURP-one-related family protein [Eubacteriaceae bacterium]
MGIFSKIDRYHGSDESANLMNMEEFGIPKRSLFTETEILSLRHKITITDEYDNVCYYAETKFPSLHDKTEIYDASGNHIAHFERKLFSIHQRHFVNMTGGCDFELSTEILHIVKDIINIEGLGWQIRGNVIGLNFQIYDSADNVIAVIAQKMLSLHDRYCIDIYMPEYEREIVTILITLQHIIRDRQASASSGSSSSSSSSK